MPKAIIITTTEEGLDRGYDIERLSSIVDGEVGWFSDWQVVNLEWEHGTVIKGSYRGDEPMHMASYDYRRRRLVGPWEEADDE